MGVKIDVEHLRFSRAQHMSDCNSGVIVDTETGSAARPGMVQATAGVEDMQWPLVRSECAPLRQAHNGAHRYQRSPDDARGDVMHARHGRCVAIAEAVTQSQLQALPLNLRSAAPGCDGLLFFRYAQPLHGSDVIGGVSEAKFFEAGRTDGKQGLWVVAPPEAACCQQIHQRHQSLRLHGMPGPEIIAKLGGIVGEAEAPYMFLLIEHECFPP